MCIRDRSGLVERRKGSRNARFGLQFTPEAAVGHLAQESCALLCLINRDEIPVSFLLPAGVWEQVCDSSAQTPFATCRREKASTVPARSVQFLRLES